MNGKPLSRAKGFTTLFADRARDQRAEAPLVAAPWPAAINRLVEYSNRSPLPRPRWDNWTTCVPYSVRMIAEKSSPPFPS